MPNIEEMPFDDFIRVLCQAKFEEVAVKFNDPNYTPWEQLPRPPKDESTQHEKLYWTLFTMFSEGVDFGIDLYLSVSKEGDDHEN